MISRKLVLSFIAIVLIIYTIAYLFELNRVSIAQSRSILAKVTELDRQIERLSFIPKLLSADTEVVSAVTNPNPSQIQTANLRLAAAQKNSGLDFAFLMDTNGITVASSNWNNDVSFVGNDYSFRPYFKGALLAKKSTYFAVGATTGEPGYFIAEPVIVASKVVGVVVAKMTLATPVETWKGLNFETAIVDEYGVVILTSNEQMLYKPIHTLSADDISVIQSERRYPVANLETEQVTQPFSQYRKYASNLSTEPWQYITLVPRKSYHITAFYLSAITLAFACIGLLLFRIYRQQKRLVAFEQEHSRVLEKQILERTEALENAQHALIAESNYAILGRMSAAINHEINQPLASLRFNLASLRKLIENPSENVEEIETTVIDSDRTTKRIGLVIATLRNYSRNDRMQMDKIDINALLDEVINAIRIERPKMSKHIIVTNNSNKVIVDGDRILLQQALLNLLYNAIDSVIQSTNPNVTLNVAELASGATIAPLSNKEYANNRTNELSDTVKYVRISVSDNGGGVPTHIISSLFEPFTTGKDTQGGLGLGLTIANQIAESHQGLLNYSGLTDGSMFTLLLPATTKRKK